MKDNRKIIGAIVGYAIGVVVCLIITMLCSCRTTKYVEVPVVKERYVNTTDTIERTDTIIRETTTVIRELDSVAMAEYGLHLRERERAFLVLKEDLLRQLSISKEVKMDTTIIRDSIPYPVPVIEEKVVVKNNWTGWLVAAVLGLMLILLVKVK